MLLLVVVVMVPFCAHDGAAGPKPVKG
jgi:hypothetical protein